MSGWWPAHGPTTTGVVTNAAITPPRCSHCGVHHHENGQPVVCPFTKAVEYWPDGSLKRVEW